MWKVICTLAVHFVYWKIQFTAQQHKQCLVSHLFILSTIYLINQSSIKQSNFTQTHGRQILKVLVCKCKWVSECVCLCVCECVCHELHNTVQTELTIPFRININVFLFPFCNFKLSKNMKAHCLETVEMIREKLCYVYSWRPANCCTLSACVISVFRRGVRSSPVWQFTQPRLVVSYRRFAKTHSS